MSVRLGLRLAVGGGRETLLRFAFTVVGVGVGITLLLLALTAQSGAKGRAERIAWQEAAYDVAEGREQPAESADGALFLAVSDYYDGAPMIRAYVAALGADPPVPPGLDRLPRPGEIAVSPAMRRLLESTPDDELDDRFPGRAIMTIGPAGLAHSDELVVLIGRTPGDLRSVGSVQEVRAFSHTTRTPSPIVSIQQFILLFGAILVLVPVVILIVMVTRVASAQRDRRLAAVRLVGATNPQIAVMASVETGLAVLAGSVLAFGAYELGRRILAATVSFQGGHFWLEDLAVAPWILVLVLAGTPVLVALVTTASLRHVRVSPLGISRRGRRPPPSAWRTVPLAVGIGGQLLPLALRDNLGDNNAGRLAAPLTLLSVVGIMLAGPWLCMIVSRGIARLSRGVPGLIAARRIAVDPRATFRVVSGVVLAACAATYIGSTTSQFVPPAEPGPDRLRPGLIHVQINGTATAQQVAPLMSERTVTTRASPRGYVVACTDLARVWSVSCPHAEDSGMVEPTPGTETLPIIDMFILTDGTLAAENRLRTQAANLVPNAIVNSDRDPIEHYTFEHAFADLGRMGTIAALFVLLVGACSLTAGMIGSLVERRRPFALLRASGMRVGELRRAVFLETGATMVVTSALGVALGLVLAYVTARQSSVSFQWPGVDVFAAVGGGVLAALAFSTFALPLLNATTRHDAVRYE